jgi:hypothetical protein
MKRVFWLVVVVCVLQFLFGPLPLTSAKNTGRGISELYASYYDLPDLEEDSFVITKPYTEPIDFLLEEWFGTWPFENLKLTEELEDGQEYSVSWEGILNVPGKGKYTFILVDVDDGARIFINDTWITDAGWLWPDPDHLPSPQRVLLKKGQYKIRIDYKQRVYYVASLQVRWSGPKFSEEVIPASSQKRGYIAATHVHSVYSDGFLRVGTILRRVNKKLKKENGGVCNITDHEFDFESVDEWTWTDEDFRVTGKVNPVRGEEWGRQVDTDNDGHSDTETGHCTVFNIDTSSDEPIQMEHESDGSGDVPMETYETFLEKASQRGALVWANHPTNNHLPWRPRVNDFNRDNKNDKYYYDAGDWVMGIEGRMVGSEVWTGAWHNLVMENQDAVDWWQRVLAEGKRKVVGMAGSDYHWSQDILGPCDRVYAKSNSPEDMAAAIKKGRVIMVKNQKSPFAVLEADANGDGIYGVFSGDTIGVGGTREVTFRITCYDSKKKNRLRIYTSSSGYQEVKCRRGDPWVYTFSDMFQADDTDFVRVEFRKKDGNMISMTNPIYINIY